MMPVALAATTISDAWFRILESILDNGYTQAIQKGSFEKEQYRLQLPGLSVWISHPSEDMVPTIPAHFGIPAPTTMEYIEDYFAHYIMNPELAENETYRYSSRINYHAYGREKSQLETVIDMLKDTPMTNQAVIEVGAPFDYAVCHGNDGKYDPPCLRVIDFKVVPPDDVLTVSVYFRSWDAWSGLPTNLGGIELLKQYVALETGLKNGDMLAYSAGAHIYGFQEDIARIRTLRKLRNNREA